MKLNCKFNRRDVITGILALICIGSFAQKVSTIDIKVNSVHEKEAVYFYEQNWLAFRIVAKKKKIITAYELLKSEVDSTNHFESTLISVYKNEIAYHAREEKFRPIMQRISPNGARYLNELKRDQFLTYVAGSTGKVIYH